MCDSAREATSQTLSAWAWALTIVAPLAEPAHPEEASLANSYRVPTRLRSAS